MLGSQSILLSQPSLKAGPAQGVLATAFAASPDFRHGFPSACGLFVDAYSFILQAVVVPVLCAVQPLLGR